MTYYQLELVKDKACAAIADAVACSYELKKDYRQAFINDLNSLFKRVDVAGKVGDITHIVSQLIAKYNEVGGVVACKKLKEFLEKVEKEPLTMKNNIVYYASELRAKEKGNKIFKKALDSSKNRIQ